MNCQATIVIEDGAPIACIVQDLSEAGARILVPDAKTLPERFSLHINGTRHQLPAQLRWKRSDCVGVQFDAPAARSPSRKVETSGT